MLVKGDLLLFFFVLLVVAVDYLIVYINSCKEKQYIKSQFKQKHY